METGTNQSAGARAWLRRAIIGRRPNVTVLRLLLLVGICFITFNFVLLPIHIQGPSMLPTYPERARLNFINRLAYIFHQPRRGDIVGIKTTGIHVMYMKRIIGLPGDTVSFHHGHAFINGKPLDEPYVKKPCDWEIEPRTLALDEYYFVGDNRSMPEADHEKGIASKAKIAGKVLL